MEAAEAVEEEVEEEVEDWRTGRTETGTLLSANWKLWRGKRGTERGRLELSITSTPSSDERKDGRARRSLYVCVCCVCAYDRVCV